jgi:hypothetical protein
VDEPLNQVFAVGLVPDPVVPFAAPICKEIGVPGVQAKFVVVAKEPPLPPAPPIVDVPAAPFFPAPIPETVNKLVTPVGGVQDVPLVKQTTVVPEQISNWTEYQRDASVSALEVVPEVEPLAPSALVLAITSEDSATPVKSNPVVQPLGVVKSDAVTLTIHAVKLTKEFGAVVVTPVDVMGGLEPEATDPIAPIGVVVDTPV